MTGRIWLAVAGLGGLASVSAGALAAHLASDPKTAELLHTGALYGMVHTAALLAIVALADRRAGIALSVAGWSFTAGIVLFSGSLFLLAESGAHWLGWVTPFGGLALMLGWIALASLALPRR
ncbi:MAG TPA: DUF423 domain-containing protein [Stellaceae bacterium]|jgi:uncharacterized membrane protein YgdD (TMEM256/DUF423 family)|nr:DUF423 domain-containing protein [Stellaceae bacterium]